MSSWLSEDAMRRLTLRELVRSQVIFAVFVRHVVPGLLRRRTRTAADLAPRLHRAVLALGPPFVKLSQVIASSPGLFPVAISNQLREMLDAAPPEPWPSVRQAIEDGLKAPLASLFADVEEEPVAAASIAQVHGATLHDGSRVVIKVRRPRVEAQFQRDLRLLRVVARLASRYWAEARVLNPEGIVDDTVENLRRELDFELEAASMERFTRNLRTFGDNSRIHVPAVHRALTAPGVLTMDRVDGIKVDDLVALRLTGLDLLDLLRAGVRAWIEGAAHHGFFHGDVHAGNLMVDGEGRAVFLDFGIMGELDDITRRIVRKGVVALLHDQDFEEVTRCLIALGVHLADRPINVERAGQAIRDLAQPLLSKPLAELDYQEILVSAIRTAAPHGVQLPRAMVLLFKQIIYFERYAKLVAPEWDILADTHLIEFMIDDPEELAAQAEAAAG